MKKKLILFACVITVTTSLWAQDIIVTNDAKKIDAKILEVSSSEVRYKELDNPKGPIFILRADEINSIIYANGKVVLYNKDNKDQDEAEVVRKRKEAEATTKANSMGNLFGKAEGVGTTGNPVGQGSRGSGSWALDGRGLRGNMPAPSKDFKQEGTVVVQIRVNAAGQVVDAKVIGGTVNDKQTQQLAIDAARKAKFTEGDGEQVGKITYIFKLN